MNATADNATVPAFEHDCDPAGGCRFLGQMSDFPQDYAPENKVIDLWIHEYDEADNYGPSLIYRWGSDGPEYSSLPFFKEGENAKWMREHPIYSEIMRRAGLV